MNLKDAILREIVRNGYAKTNGNKVWDVAQRRFLYFTPGQAEKFLNLRSFELYKKQVIDREIALIRKNAKMISKKIGKESFNLIDIFCGDGLKAKEFIRAIEKKAAIRYCPVNVNDRLVRLASENVKKEGFDHVKEHEEFLHNGGDKSFFEALVKMRGNKYKKNVILLLGSVLASYEINDYLYNISETMLPGDYLIIGNGIRVGKRLVSLKTYQNDIFHQWFIHLMREVGFKDEEIEYDARFGNSRVEGFYKLKSNKTLNYKGKKIKFRKGDEVLVATLFKYYARELEKFCKMYFSEVELIKDKDNEYVLVICRK